MRELRVLDEINVTEWTKDEGFAHLLDTFRRNVRQFSDLMEPFVTATGLTDDRDEQMRIMRNALASTINQRFPPAGTA